MNAPALTGDGDLSERDVAMIRHAVARGQVVVELPGRARRALCTLIAWRPHRSDGRRRQDARVELRSGARLSVPLSAVSILGEEPVL